MAKATKEQKTYRPEQLAETLGITGKQVRSYLRKEFPRKAEERNTSWSLTADQAKQVLAHFRKAAAPAKDEA